MASRIDKASITDAALGYTLAWRHASFEWNTSIPLTSFMDMAREAIRKARRPTADEALETTLRGRFGEAFVRQDPTPPEVVPMLVKVVP